MSERDPKLVEHDAKANPEGATLERNDPAMRARRRLLMAYQHATPQELHALEQWVRTVDERLAREARRG